MGFLVWALNLPSHDADGGGGQADIIAQTHKAPNAQPESAVTAEESNADAADGSGKDNSLVLASDDDHENLVDHPCVAPEKQAGFAPY